MERLAQAIGIPRRLPVPGTIMFPDIGAQAIPGVGQAVMIAPYERQLRGQRSLPGLGSGRSGTIKSGSVLKKAITSLTVAHQWELPRD
jgi:hypothetical protein